MATIPVGRSVPETLHHTCVIATWTPLANGDEGAPVELANFADRTVQVVGAFGGGGNLRIEGSLDGENWAPLTDPQGNFLDIQTAKIEAITEIVRWVRPRVTAGDGTTSLTVTMLLRGTNR